MTSAQLSTIKDGYLISDKDFDDYAIKAGERYKVHKDHMGYYIHVDDFISLNGEMTDELLECLRWEEN